MKLSKVEEQGVKIAKVTSPNADQQKFDLEKEIKEIKELLKEILQNIAKTSWLLCSSLI